MAAKGFNESLCEDCKASSNNLSYHVSVCQVLCVKCAERKKDHILKIDEPLTGPNCTNHGDVQAGAFCHSHGVWLCHECAFKCHRNPCEAVEIDDEISERKEKLADILPRAKAQEGALLMLDQTTDRIINKANEDLASLRRHVSTARKEELQKLEDKRTKMSADIGQEADAQIRKIKEARDKKLHQVDEDATKERRLVELGDVMLQGSINRVDEALQSRSKEMKSKMLKVTTALAHSTDAAKVMAEQGRYTANDFHPIAASLEETMKADVDIGIIEKVASIASDIAFHRVDGPVLGKVTASTERWEKASEFYPSMGRCFVMKGYINQDEVLLQDVISGSVNVTSLTRECICKDIETRNIQRTFSCASLHDQWIACGTKDGTVVIYDTKWKALRTINVTRHRADILVSVETLNGLILASVKSESRVNFYNPDDGKLVHAIDVSYDRHIEEMHAMPSGFIAIRTQCPEGPDVCVLQYQPGHVHFRSHHFHGKTVHNIAVDQANDAIYVMSSECGHLDFHVISSKDDVRVAEINVVLNPAWYYQTCIIPKTGCIVICHNGKVHVFKQVSRNQQLHELLESEELFPGTTHQSIYV